jgi:hypothetical protein
MTTKVTIENHGPDVVLVGKMDGDQLVGDFATLRINEILEEYVHSHQSLKIVEFSPAKMST